MAILKIVEKVGSIYILKHNETQDSPLENSSSLHQIANCHLNP